MTPAYLRPQEAADYMSLNRGTVYRLVSQGLLKMKKVGGARLIAVKDIARLIEESPAAEIQYRTTKTTK